MYFLEFSSMRKKEMKPSLGVKLNIQLDSQTNPGGYRGRSQGQAYNFVVSTLFPNWRHSVAFQGLDVKKMSCWRLTFWVFLFFYFFFGWKDLGRVLESFYAMELKCWTRADLCIVRVRQMLYRSRSREAGQISSFCSPEFSIFHHALFKNTSNTSCSSCLSPRFKGVWS